LNAAANILGTDNQATIQLEMLLTEASKNVSFYKGVASKLETFPIVSKHDILKQPERFLSDRISADREMVLSTVLGSDSEFHAAQLAEKGIVIEKTSGSSGIPFRFPVLVSERMAIAHAIWTKRKSVDESVSVSNFVPVIHAPQSSYRISRFTDFVKMLNFSKPRWIHVSPDFIREFAAFLRGLPKVSCHLPVYVECSGARLDDVLRSELQHSLGLSILDQYGCRESSAIAYKIGGSEFVVLSSNVLVELIDANDRLIIDPGFVGRVVVTAFKQHIFPFIRYDTGDLALWSDKISVGKSFRLTPFRKSEEILGTNGVFGTPIFKEILIGLYRLYGHLNIHAIQFQQRSLNSIVIISQPSVLTSEMVAHIRNRFNARRVLPGAVDFHLVDECVRMPINTEGSKAPSLFTNSTFVSPKLTSR
jgi:phenylacetate-coenzyme A ligase PaaK-like adenylate-forming protein